MTLGLTRTQTPNPECFEETLPPILAQDALKARYGIAPGAEIGMEADPGTFDAQKLQSYLSLGITRLSVGVQSFDDGTLRLCGRSHTAADVDR